MIELPEAWALVAEGVRPLPAERVALGEAQDRIAANDVLSAVDLPPFDRSAMDGYAVRAADTGAGPLRLVGDIAAGATATVELEPGTAIGIATGAALPPGADAVLQSELATVADGHVEAARAVEPGRHVRFRGEDVRAGDVLAPAGAVLTLPARELAGRRRASAELDVHRRARVHILVTGSELLPLGAPPEPGKIHESNGLLLRLLAQRSGAEIIEHGVVADDAQATREAVEAGLGGDVLVVSGGVSVGPHDHVRPAFAACGVEEVFWRVRVKPGKPLWFGRRGDTLVFGLPGNPLSSIVGFLALIDPALRRLHGEAGATMRTARPPDVAAGPSGRPHHVPELAPGPRRRRRARGHADRGPGLAPDRRPRGVRRLRHRSPRC